ncbi:hypothetical protein C8Q78DRAFT_991858 [Trametes maxima]|nr:hypothetical protein C8Q78DRAFT_991858 [Trametes maxima]
MGKSQNEELKEELKGDKCQTEVGCRSPDGRLAQMMEKEIGVRGWSLENLMEFWSGSQSEQMSNWRMNYCWTNCHTEVVTVFRNLLALKVINSHVFGSFGEELSGEWGKQGGHHPRVELMFLQITTVFRALAPPIVAQFPRILLFGQKLSVLWTKQNGHHPTVGWQCFKSHQCFAFYDLLKGLNCHTVQYILLALKMRKNCDLFEVI